VAENNSVGHSQHFSLILCMTEPIVLRKQRSGKTRFWDVNDWEIYNQFVRHIRRERTTLLMQQNVLPRSLSTNNILYLCDAKQATVNNYDKSNSDASAETEMWTYEPYVNFEWTIQSILCDKQNVKNRDATRTCTSSACYCTLQATWMLYKVCTCVIKAWREREARSKIRNINSLTMHGLSR